MPASRMHRVLLRHGLNRLDCRLPPPVGRICSEPRSPQRQEAIILPGDDATVPFPLTAVHDQPSRIHGSRVRLPSPPPSYSSSARSATSPPVGHERWRGRCTIQVWAMIAFALVTVSLARLRERAAPRAAATLTLVGLIGAAGGVGYGIDSVQAAISTREASRRPTARSHPWPCSCRACCSR